MSEKKKIEIEGEEPLRTYKKLMPVKLNPTEQDAASKAAGKLDAKIDNMVQKLSDDSAEAKAAIKEQRAKLKSMMKTLATGTQDVEVECGDIPDFDRNKVMVYRLDTKEKVDERAMRPEERQKDLGVKDPKDKAKN